MSDQRERCGNAGRAASVAPGNRAGVRPRRASVRSWAWQIAQLAQVSGQVQAREVAA